MKDVRCGGCSTCGEALHYRYPCKCRREDTNPTVITLCGSTKFKDVFESENKNLTMAGNLVISVGVFGHSDGVEMTAEEKAMLDNIHLRKIDLADVVRVLNVGGYIGESTRREVEYAESTGKIISYLERIK